jgi:hypothetical protein
MICDEQQQLEASLDHFLMLMHRYGSADQVGRGYPSRAAGTEQYRPSRQYDNENGAMDGDVDHTIAASVCRIVDAMTDPHRTSLRIEARNLVTGVKAWSSARLPLCPVERSIVRTEARNRLWRALIAAGIA